jgi:hypothetical protein
MHPKHPDNMNTWSKRFRRNLGFWSLQCVISALPGFCIAMGFLKLHENPLAALAMFAALGTFILVLNALASLSGTLTGWRTLPSRGLRLGLQIRGISSGASLMVIAAIIATGNDYQNPVIFVMPDVWTGAAALIPPSLLAEELGFKDPVGQFMDQETDLSFAMIYAISVIDGMILSFLIFIVSFISMLILQIRDRKAMYRNRPQLGAAILAKLRSLMPASR